MKRHAALATLDERTIYEACYALLCRLGFRTYRLSQARASKQTPGLPDLLAYLHLPHRNLEVWIEVKRPGGRWRVEQQQFCAGVALLSSPNVHYLLVHSAQELADHLSALRAA